MGFSASNLILKNQKYSNKLTSFLSDFYLIISIKFYDIKCFLHFVENRLFLPILNNPEFGLLGYTFFDEMLHCQQDLDYYYKD